MSEMRAAIDGQPVIDDEDKYDSISVAASATATTILDFRTRHGAKGYIVAIRNAVGAGGATQITNRVMVNGTRLRNYEGFQHQKGEPGKSDFLPSPIELPQSARVQFVADNADAGAAYVVDAQIVVYYVDPI